MGNFVAGPGIYPREHGDYSILEITPELARRVHAFLSAPYIPDRFGWDSFIEWALARAENLMAECNDDGSRYCMTHDSVADVYESFDMLTEDDIFVCDARRDWGNTLAP